MGAHEVDTAEELYATWNAGGIPAVAARFWAPEIEWRDDPSIPDANVFQGRDAVRRHIEERVELLGKFEITIEQLVDAGDGCVLAVYEVHGRGGYSAAPFSVRIAQHLTFEGDRVVRVQDHLDPDAALKTVR